MEGIKNRIFPEREFEVKNLKKRPVEDLRTMWSGLDSAKVQFKIENWENE